MRLGIEITGRCNASCKHCSTSCGPHRRANLTTEDLLDIMNQMANIKDDRPLEFAFTGGEPFLDLLQLETLIRHGDSLGARITCMSNSYWATTLERATAILMPLHKAGLGVLGLSTSGFHSPFVPRVRLINALHAARGLGMRTTIKCAITALERESVRSLEWLEFISLADEVVYFAVLGPGRDGAKFDDEELILTEGIPNGPCPSIDMMVAEDGSAIVCCTSARVNSFHSLGSALDNGLERCIIAGRRRGKFQLLRSKGPIHFAEEIRRRGLGSQLRSHYHDACDLCSHIAHDAALSEIAEEMGEALEKKQLYEVFSFLGDDVRNENKH